VVRAEVTVISVTFATDAGARRENEDNYLVAPADAAASIFAVADGMGGHRAGATAARLAVEGLWDGFAAGESLHVAARLRTAVKTANRAVVTGSSKPGCRGMGTTLAALTLAPGGEGSSATTGVGAVAWAGDSRVGVLRAGAPALEWVTRDHSERQEAVDSGATPEELRFVPSNVISRCLGTRKDEGGEHRPVTWGPGDTFVLCSDGLWGVLEDEAVAWVLANGGDAQALVDAALARGHRGQDNLTAIVVRT
jgi:PPM family protein phosphatase